MIGHVETFAEYCAAALEFSGAAAIVLFAAYATAHAVVRLVRREEHGALFSEYRHRLAGGILLGLEFLVAADIIRTVAVELTLRSVAVLAIIVGIRTFLSFTIELEMTGRWPWQGG